MDDDLISDDEELDGWSISLHWKQQECVGSNFLFVREYGQPIMLCNKRLQVVILTV